MEKRIIFPGHTRRPIGTPVPHDSQSPAQRIFLLSPANASGIRGTRLFMKVKISPSGPLVVPSLRARSNCARPLTRLPSERSGNDTQIVLLGSIATQKYVAPLLDIFGKRLVFPCDFVGRGDMSRGGLLLRCSRDSTRLEYVAVANAARRGPRPQSRGTCCTTCLSTRGGRQATRGW
jgi:hypothetical protein